MTSLPIDKKALILAELLMAALSAYRSLSYVITGFFVSDEFGYFYNATTGNIYGNRWFFGWVNVFLFDIFNIRSPDSFAFLLPFYLFFWGGLTFYAFYRLLKLLDFGRVTVALSVVSSLVLVSFVLLSLGFLTEGAGLAMAMVGAYFLVRFMKSETLRGRIVSLVFAALFLGFAGGTREPYVAMEIGGIGLVVLASFKPPVRVSKSRLDAKGLAALSLLAFMVPTGVMLYANTATTSTVAPLATGLVEIFFTNPANNVTSSTTSVTNNGVITQNAGYVPFYGRSLLLNTIAIFLGGVFLGWGPIAFPIALLGFLILTKASWRKEPISLALLVLVLSALGSDLVVSYIFAPIPDYLTFKNYSTIIRFSGTALPAFFLTAPFFLDVVARKRRRIFGLLGIIAVSLLILVPVYQIYAISNLGYTTVSPFGLDYRSPAVQARDYFNGHPADAPFHVIGVPYGWPFTPGIGGLRTVDIYSPTPEHTLSPSLNYSAFLAKHWTKFYIYSSSNFVYEEATSPYILQFIPGAPAQPTTSHTTPFRIVNSTVVIRNPDFLFTKVELSWPNPDT